MKLFSLIIPALLVSVTVSSQDLLPVKLNAPDLNKGMTMMKAFEKRASSQDVAPGKLSIQDISDLLWAANGINRPEAGKRTAPSAMNAQDIDIYVFLAEGVYIYDAKANILKPVVAGDHRSMIKGKGFDNAPMFLLLVSDISRFKFGEESLKIGWGNMDGGIVSENISLFCAATGMGTRPRAGMPVEELTKLLKLSPSQHLILNHPIGYLAK
jgi:hypothetical protein